jgi:hypothetical protein
MAAMIAQKEAARCDGRRAFHATLLNDVGERVITKALADAD